MLLSPFYTDNLGKSTQMSHILSNKSLLRLNLNLLKLLAAIQSAGSLKGAADILGRSQPAVSQMLAQLRAITGDPILVREGNSFKVTPFATDRIDAVHQILHLSHDVLCAERDINPTLVMPPIILEGLNDLSQKIIRATHLHFGSCNILSHFEFAQLSAYGSVLPIFFHAENKFFPNYINFVTNFKYLLCARKGHLLTKKRFASLADALEFSFATLADKNTETSSVSMSLSKIGVSRKISLRASQWSSILAHISSSEDIAFVPEPIFFSPINSFDLEIVNTEEVVSYKYYSSIFEKHLDLYEDIISASGFFREETNRLAAE